MTTGAGPEAQAEATAAGWNVVLRDGSTISVRGAEPTDEPALAAFYRALNDESIALRFFSLGVDPAAEARRALSYGGGHGLVATHGTPERIVAHAIYAPVGPGTAELALAVADAWQGRGIGTVLLGNLAQIAARGGIDRFEALVLPHNRTMLATFRDSGFRTESRISDGQIVVIIETALTAAAQHEYDRRDQAAARSALQRFIRPASVAVIGASRRRGTVGGEVFHNLLAGNFNGPVYPVNSGAEVVQSVRAYPNIAAVPGPVDLAVITVPASAVLAVAEECAGAGVPALLVLTAGFHEVGGEKGPLRQRELLTLCRQSGMRMIGPNCFGVLNTDAAVRLNATFGPENALPGPLALASQSGALGLAAIAEAATRGVGISSFVSMGNKADISGNDLLGYWEQDDRTSVILLYLESFGNPRKFGRIAPRVSRVKPIVALKSGRSSAGARAAASHTGALLAGSDVVVDALFRHAGVIRVDTISQLFDVGMLLADQPIPTGRRVAMLTNVGGPAILCADACEAQGLDIPMLSPETQTRLRTFLPAEAAVSNPVDMLAAATADQYEQALRVLGQDPEIDAIIVLFLRPLATSSEQVARAVMAARHDSAPSKTVIAVFMGSPAAPPQLRGAEGSIPSFAYPEAAAIALGHAVRYGKWRARAPRDSARTPTPAADDARAIIAAALRRGEGWLMPDEVAGVLGSYGIPLARQEIVANAEAAAAAAARVGAPVALKAIVPGLTHKTDAGGVRLGLRGAAQVRRAAHQMTAHLRSLGHSIEALLVQPMALPGTEMLVGVAQDPQFGPVIVCGAGGVQVELLKDVSVRLVPIDLQDAGEMVRELRSFPLLTGYRGTPTRDVAALEDVLLEVSALADDCPAVAELDCNPVIVHDRGVVVVDARIRVAERAPERPLGSR